MIPKSGLPFLSKSACEKLVTAPTVIVFVGLPGTSKTFLSRKLCNYLNWIGVSTKQFNVSEYRRLSANYNTKVIHDCSDEKSGKIIENFTLIALHDLCEWLNCGGEIGILDGTNATRERRKLIFQECTERHKFRLFFVEHICDNPNFFGCCLETLRNIDPDFKHMSVDMSSTIDFNERVEYFRSIYEPLDATVDHEKSYVKIVNNGEKFIVNKLKGRIPSRVVYYLMNLKILPNCIYLVRHGESEYNLQCRIGGDSPLSKRGKLFATALADYFNSKAQPNLVVFTSTFKRTIQTAARICAPKEQWNALDEINAGICNELTYKEIASKYPEELLKRDQNKYYYRYPQGESYQDLIARLEPVILALDRSEKVLVICHQAVARCLLGYLKGIPPMETPYIEIPLHTILKISPGSYGIGYEEIPLGIECVSTHRPKPSNLTSNRTIGEALSTLPDCFQ